MLLSISRTFRLLGVNLLALTGFVGLLEILSFFYLISIGEQSNLFYSTAPFTALPSHPILGWSQDTERLTESGVEVQGNWVRYPSSIESKDTLVIAVIGGSTTDNVLNPDNWPLKLQRLLNEKGIAVDVYNGAVAGYGSRQELTLAKNYLSHILPDILISYSGVNECINYSRLNNEIVFPPNGAKFKVLPNLFKLISKMQIHGNRDSKVQCFSDLGDDLAVQWMLNMNELHEISERQQVHFISILQPSVVTLNPRKTEFEKEIFVPDHYEPFYVNVKEHMLKYDFIHDLSNAFDTIANPYSDDCHVSAKGNEIIAIGVIKILESDFPRLEQTTVADTAMQTLSK